jgi:hypothetical protein
LEQVLSLRQALMQRLKELWNLESLELQHSIRRYLAMMRLSRSNRPQRRRLPVARVRL